MDERCNLVGKADKAGCPWLVVLFCASVHLVVTKTEDHGREEEPFKRWRNRRSLDKGEEVFRWSEDGCSILQLLASINKTRNSRG